MQLTTSFGQKLLSIGEEIETAAIVMGLPTDEDSLQRIVEANAILFDGRVKATAIDYLFKIADQQNYLVLQHGTKYQCTCLEYSKHQRPCQHTIAVHGYNILVDQSYQEELVEAFDTDGSYYRFMKLVPSGNQIPTLELCNAY